MSHVPKNITNNVSRHVRETGLPADKIGVKIQIEQLGVVIEHLFEMRHQPARIGRITGKATSNLIVNSPSRHALTGVENHLDGLLILETRAIAQEKSRMARRRKLRRGAPPAMFCIVTLLQSGAGAAQNCARQD